MKHSNETEGELLWPFLVEFLQFTVQMSKLNGLGKTHRKRIFDVRLKF